MTEVQHPADEPFEDQDIEIPDDVREFATQLFDLCRQGGPDAVRTMDECLAEGLPPDLANQDGNTFLMLAAYNGNADVLEVLIRHGADVNALNDRGQSPLAGAIFKKEDAVIDLLLDAGADPQAGHPTALQSAEMFGRPDLVERLHAAGPDAGEESEN
ncbi:ankyrin repeat domain-containing protein [Corynebacterium uropygiale]|uniref:Ankyrin repeat domain-containing protein n=1 Tax=Corynebacterium uropygiale TaxID=1775911 RepID=A0A9X1QSG1_9CORY|nr:ankyrin repeat domain-containing protein [Corynebacterium uropygiale]MCF4007547.1 ankyrin repeat domain-containing protein [Corynebacterium uropygiale]